MNKNYFRIMLGVAAVALIVVAYAAFRPQSAAIPAQTDTSQETTIPAEPSPVESASGPQSVSTGIFHAKWSPPEAIDPIDVFTPFYKGEGSDDEYMAKEYANRENYKRVGTVLDGAYAGGDVVVVFVAAADLGDPSYYHFIVPKSGKPVLLALHSPQASVAPQQYGPARFDESKFVVDTTAGNPDLIFPTEISSRGARLTLQTANFGQFDAQKDAPFFDANSKVLAFTDPKIGKVYTDRDAKRPQNGFYAVAPDGTVRVYALEIPFYDANLHMPDVTWSNGIKNTEEYWATDIGGCGAENYAAVVDEVEDTELLPVGKTAQGEPIYRFKDGNHPVLKDVYENVYSLGRGDDKLSYEAFVAANPVFLWRDPLNRLIKFQKAAFLPAVECGKPVIYLYPEKTTDVNVKLAPQGGFTKTEPAYDGGWNVRATPKGELTNLKDGKVYPYLFWEGRGGLYETPKRGFVIAQKEVHGFLIEKLSALGLSAQERADFMEFWEPRMTGSPYYFVTFLGNRAMEAIAPLDVAPKPDTVIRVLMDFLPLEKPIDVQGYEIHTPKRDGFTVVEWGGVLR